MSDGSPILFLDFDGTISRADVVDALLERFALPEWRQLEDEWRAGNIGSRECLSGQVGCIRAMPDAVDAAIDAIPLDDGLGTLLETASRHDIPVHILSDGFDYCIARLLRTLPSRLGRPLLENVYASHLEPSAAGTWRTAFPFYPAGCEHGCATCKPRMMRELNPDSRPAIFVGDGLSDRYAVGVADVVFAKQGLAAYCEREGIGYAPYADLTMVAAGIERTARSGHAWALRAARVGL